jgi:DNA-binding response OmpR family regulator
MNDKAGKVLVVESNDSLRDHIVAALSDAGCEVSTDRRGGMKSVVAFNPDTVVLGADPPQLDCCDLLF